MRRDVCYFFAADVRAVYNAYLTAASNAPFGRDCDQKPWHTFSFGLNYSWKYNMNGGACTLHFIPYRGGAAVDLRFSIAQGFGAKYEKYAQELTNAAVAVLRVPSQPLNLDIEEFLKPANQVVAAATPRPAPIPQPAATPRSAAPTTAPRPAAPAAAPVRERICRNCGSVLHPEAAFCGHCGAKAASGCRLCSRCGKEVPANTSFCIYCGNPL